MNINLSVSACDNHNQISFNNQHYCIMNASAFLTKAIKLIKKGLKLQTQNTYVNVKIMLIYLFKKEILIS